MTRSVIFFCGPLGMLGQYILLLVCCLYVMLSVVKHPMGCALLYGTPRQARGDMRLFAMGPLGKLGMTGAYLPWNPSASSG